jgi:hypothetical protein
MRATPIKEEVMARSTTSPRTRTAKPKTPAKPKPAEQPPVEDLDLTEQPNQPRKREVSEAQQAVIDRILTLRREGKGLPTIAKTLNDENVPTFGKGDKWHPPVVRAICLRNGVERGEA